MSQSTPYTETEFLLAVMEERLTDATQIVTGMLPTERRKLKVQLREAALLIEGFEDTLSEIEEGRADPDFMERIKKSVEDNQPILDKLKDGDS